MARSVLFESDRAPADRTRGPILHLTVPLFRIHSESQGSLRRTRVNTDTTVKPLGVNPMLAIL